jgi:hypothetical protein
MQRVTEARTHRLADNARTHYVQTSAALLGDRRLNQSFMPPSELQALFRHLMAARPEALDARDTLEIDTRSGLPTLPEFLRARARAQVLERFRVEARVRRSTGQSADLKVIVDRFDPGESLFRRASVELHVAGSREVTIQNDEAELSGTLRDTLFRFATADAELLYLRLCQVPDVRVTDLKVGQTGPLIFQGMQVPTLFKEVLKRRPDAFFLCAATSRISPALESKGHRNPLSTPLQQVLGESAYLELQAASPEPYGVRKDLLFVATPATAAILRTECPGHIVFSRKVSA